MTTVQTVEHRGVRVLIFDFSGASTKDEILRRIAEATGVAAQHPEGSLVTLTRCADAYVDGEVVQALGAFVAGNGPYVKAAAVTGTEGHLDEVRQLVAGMARRELESFESEAAALDWLAAQAGG